jgi:hypothetical protein
MEMSFKKWMEVAGCQGGLEPIKELPTAFTNGLPHYNDDENPPTKKKFMKAKNKKAR